MDFQRLVGNHKKVTYTSFLSHSSPFWLLNEVYIDMLTEEKPTTLDCGPRTICKRHIMTSSNLYECLWEALQQRIRMITCS
ncbi:hypothetical protein ES332_A03G130800v1 [Gossypium tomentosum]|uniref:Uncharacterized protein n=1 Tax=Gossypium tomentosum TaxID=34277 RepID=A0A5D2R6H4_GOSTO|nr:hypothetical protein ES332_A03G130800v1 [Gossypium tomentosum]